MSRVAPSAHREAATLQLDTLRRARRRPRKSHGEARMGYIEGRPRPRPAIVVGVPLENAAKLNRRGVVLRPLDGKVRCRDNGILR